MNFRDEAAALAEQWGRGNRTSVALRLRSWDSLTACAVCAQLVLIFLDEADDEEDPLPDFIEFIENIDDSQLKVGEVMEG